MRFFTSRHAEPGALHAERIAVLGYGHLGRPLALNLRDSGVEGLVIGNIEDKYSARARQDRFDVLSIAAAVAGADIDLFIEQTLGAVLGTAVMQAFAIGEDAGIPPEALVMEMYMSEEMEMVFRAFRELGFFNASSAHGPTALYGGFVRTMQFMGSGLGGIFRDILEEIQSGEFARKFQAEREAGYPMLTQAEAMSTADSPIAQAEARVRAMLGQKQ
jgi:ketol-acid reductoisomerase